MKVVQISDPVKKIVARSFFLLQKLFAQFIKFCWPNLLMKCAVFANIIFILSTFNSVLKKQFIELN